jgi:hypothetical protein
MSENDNPSKSDSDSGVTDAQILNGGIEIEVAKIDGSLEKVKVRQLPISIVGEWGHNQSGENEAYLIELLCDKVDRATTFHLRNAQVAEMRVLQILQQAPFEQIEPIQKRLAAIRQEIAQHEAKPRWSDSLTHESAAAIREFGERLNKKKYVDQITRTANSAKTLLETLPKSPEPSSSSPSPASDASPSTT